MTYKKLLTIIVFCFVVLCGLLVYNSGIFSAAAKMPGKCILLQNTTEETAGISDANAQDINAQDANAQPVIQPSIQITYTASDAEPQTITLGSTDKESGFKFLVELTSKGAAIQKAVFSEFNDRNYKNPQPLVILSPVTKNDKTQILPMANANLTFVEQKLMLPLDKLQWKASGKLTDIDGTQSASFEADIKTSDGLPILKLIKSYKVIPGSYNLLCDINIVNLSQNKQKINFELTGPLGIGREDAMRDMRKTIAGFRNSQGNVTISELAIGKLSKAESIDDMRLVRNSDNFLWAAAVNKYFASILVPVAQNEKDFCDWIADKKALFYNPDGDKKASTGDETIGVSLKTSSINLAPADSQSSSQSFSFLLYTGPKNKPFFDKNDLYRSLGFVHVIDFPACGCPAAMIRPLAFGILTVMEALYTVFRNYGIAIIILVFLIRIAIHPLTKKSQVSMSKFSKIAPKAEEIKKKYENNKAEMNKQIMALYKEQGASPITGMLPMLVQMPIWIALYSAINSSISLRGAAFLPFWITDLSAPDALIRFTAFKVPLLGWTIDSLNLLPILMGVAFYLQQKLMPSQAASASTNPQVAQQQKMMMIMMPILFPIMLYKAPSGLNLYIMASTFAGVIESDIIKKHIKKKEAEEEKGLVSATSKTGGKVKKKKPKPFFKKF